MSKIIATNSLQINHERLKKRLVDLSLIGRIQETGVCRLTLSEEDKQAQLLVEKWMHGAGLVTKIDPLGNLIGQWIGKDDSLPILMVGSHIDSQPYGGQFDGPVGVLGALEAIETMKEQGYQPERTIEVISFTDEEGCRFDKGLFGSRGIIGLLEENELERKDHNGITRRQALIEFGCNPDKLEEAVYPKGRIGSFLEMHIEQGPILDRGNKPVGLVTGISGPLWLTVELKGFAGHAGSVPMDHRQDALLAAAEIIITLRKLVTVDSAAPTVGTVGKIEAFPNSRNIIPENVSFSIDLRDIDITRRRKIEKELYKAIDEICDRHQVNKTIIVDTDSEPRYSSKEILDEMRAAAKMVFDEPLPELMSGPFHDALAMSNICDFGMIFVRCKDGISHNPKESCYYEDISLGTELLYRTIILRCDAKNNG